MDEDLRDLWKHYKMIKFYIKSQHKFRGRQHSKRRREYKKRIGNKCRVSQVCCHGPLSVANIVEKHCFYTHTAHIGPWGGVVFISWFSSGFVKLRI